MSGILKYEHLEINENKSRYSFEEENLFFDGLENPEEDLSKDFSLNKEETTKINFFKTKLQNLDIKDQILLNQLHDIKLSLKNENSQKYYIENEKDGRNEYNICSNIFNTIDRMVHKILHKKKMINGKEVKECIFYGNLNEQTVKYNEKNNVIYKLKEENKNIEFIEIEAIMISLTNLMTELIQNYLAKSKQLLNELKEEKNGNDEEDNDLIEANIFEYIYNEFVFQSNVCSSELESKFTFSLNRFREESKMNFTLSELYTDIFWNSIFHNKKLCTLFLNSYFNNEIYGDIKLYLNKILKIIFNAHIPLRQKIVEFLGLQQLENNEENDLISLVVYKKKIYRAELIKAEKEKEKKKELMNKINQQKIEEEENKNNETDIEILRKNDKEIINSNKAKKDEIENGQFNIIIANDISVIKKAKLEKGKNIVNNINVGLNFDNNNKKEKEKEKENKEKENNKNYLNKKKSNENFGLEDIEHKTVDELYNYINDGKKVKNKKKKKSRKNKKAKKESIVDENQEEIADMIVQKFKEDLNDKCIHARSITKIKPIISEQWIKKISHYD